MDYSAARAKMVETQLRKRNINDDKVLHVMNHIPREKFVTGASTFMAYHDFPLPIGKGQTMSQPYIVALMTQLLKLRGGEKILEVGTGSGYQAAVLSKLCKKVITMELDKQLAAQAQTRLLAGGYRNAKVVVGDGSLGYIYAAPFDGIIVTAGTEKIPQTLLDQLKVGGRLIIPIGNRGMQTLQVIHKKKTDEGIKLIIEKSTDCRFVPLRGKYGWH